MSQPDNLLLNLWKCYQHTAVLQSDSNDVKRDWVRSSGFVIVRGNKKRRPFIVWPPVLQFLTSGQELERGHRSLCRAHRDYLIYPLAQVLQYII